MTDALRHGRMTDPSGAPAPARLFTNWGTVLHVDDATGELRHGPSAGSPANAVFNAERAAAGARRGWLEHDRDGAREPIVCLPERSLTVSGSGGKDKGTGPTLLEIVPLERGLIALRSGNLFLCAEPAGQITLSRSVCGLWECFLASEDWCSDRAVVGDPPTSPDPTLAIDWQNIAGYNINPLIRAVVNAKSKRKKVLFYGYIRRSHGRIYYDLRKHLMIRRYIADILDWQVDHSRDINQLMSYYDLFITSLDGIHTLADIYGIPLERIVGLVHSESDLHLFIERHGLAGFARLAAYGVVSYSLLFSSLTLGVTRIPAVVPVGIDVAAFSSELPERLSTVGYASTISVVSKHGVELKREALARECAEAAGLGYRRSASPESYLWFLDMPDFYRRVDAVLIPSLQEGAGLPAMEAAAAGRLVISTPVGHFPLRAYQGGGFIAPLERDQFKKFAVETLRYYKENLAAYVDKCRQIQEAARQFDWTYTIGDWVQMIESTK